MSCREQVLIDGTWHACRAVNAHQRHWVTIEGQMTTPSLNSDDDRPVRVKVEWFTP